MTVFRFNSFTPHPLLRPYVAKMCVFESSGRLPAEDRKLIVPNANLKLTLTYKNGIVARIAGKTFIQKENEVSLSGLIDSPVILDPEEDATTGTIIVEFNPLGAYKLFRFSYAGVKNQIVELQDIVGTKAKELQSKLTDAVAVNHKLEILQRFLINQLDCMVPDPIYDHCVKRISDSRGLVSIARLEKETGYSARWLHSKFSEHLGTGPKNLAEIVRFKQFYEVFSTGVKLQNLKENIYGYYHDQSHFIRAFKRFTGFTPTDLQNSANELATRHYSS